MGSILRNVFGESRPGRICSPSLPLKMLEFANVAFAPNAAPEREEKKLLRRVSGLLGKVTEIASSTELV